MIRARILTALGAINASVALLVALTLVVGAPMPASSAPLGFTPTSPPLPTEEPTEEPTEMPTEEPTEMPQHPDPGTAPGAFLTITKSSGSAEVFPGDWVSFGVRVCNEGDAVAPNVVASDSVPCELTGVSASTTQGRAVVEGNGVRAEFGAIEPGRCASLRISARVRVDVSPGTTIRNVGSVGDVYDDSYVTVVAPLPLSGGRAVPILLVVLLISGLAMMAAGWRHARREA